MKIRNLMPLFLGLSLCFGACDDGGSSNDPTPTPEPCPIVLPSFVTGADLSWVTEMENDGVKFYNKSGQETDCFALMKEQGVEAIRLRVWVDSSKSPYEKLYCHKTDVVGKAVRAKAQGMDVMIDFHYSDWFADPSRQETPADWADMDLASLKEAVAEHTTDILSALKAEGVTPKWIQIGNETRNGMLHPAGQLWNDSGNIEGGWKNYVALSNAGYDAAKAACPDAYVMIHLNDAWNTDDNTWWLGEFKANGGKMDMIGLSHYPQSKDGMTWKQLNNQACQNMERWAYVYSVPVMVCEVGVKPGTGTEAVNALSDFMESVLALAPDCCAGVFYWEPQVYGGWKPACYTTLGWNAYDMGAFDESGKPGAVMEAFKE